MSNIDFASQDYQAYFKDQKGDNNVTHLSDQIFKYMDHLTGLVPEVASHKILDVGCRSFDTYDWFLSKGTEIGSIVGVDIGEEGLEYCKTHNKPCINCDAHRLLETFSPETFDIVLAFHSLEHMYDMPLVLGNIFKVLRPGGFLYLAVPIPSSNERKGHWVDIPDGAFMKRQCITAGFNEPAYEETVDSKFRIANEYVALVRKPEADNV